MVKCNKGYKIQPVKQAAGYSIGVLNEDGTPQCVFSDDVCCETAEKAMEFAEHMRLHHCPTTSCTCGADCGLYKAPDKEQSEEEIHEELRALPTLMELTNSPKTKEQSDVIMTSLARVWGEDSPEYKELCHAPHQRIFEKKISKNNPFRNSLLEMIDHLRHTEPANKWYGLYSMIHQIKEDLACAKLNVEGSDHKETLWHEVHDRQYQTGDPMLSAYYSRHSIRSLSKFNAQGLEHKNISRMVLMDLIWITNQLGYLWTYPSSLLRSVYEFLLMDYLEFLDSATDMGENRKPTERDLGHIRNGAEIRKRYLYQFRAVVQSAVRELGADASAEAVCEQLKSFYDALAQVPCIDFVAKACKHYNL